MERENTKAFDYGIYYFLVENFFNDFVERDKVLREMYLGDGVDVLEFIDVFNARLSEAIRNFYSRMRSFMYRGMITLPEKQNWI